jgi:hypothetical protein
VGRKRAVWLYVALAAAGLLIVPAGVAVGVFPAACLAALLALPFLVASGRSALATYEAPRLFVPAIRSIVRCYLVAMILFTAGILLAGGGGSDEPPHRPAPRFVRFWQITRDCDLCCLHCCTESAPGRRLRTSSMSMKR